LQEGGIITLKSKGIFGESKAWKKMSDDYTVINREIIIDAPIDKVFSAASDNHK
jgi:hypothetical protein